MCLDNVSKDFTIYNMKKKKKKKKIKKKKVIANNFSVDYRSINTNENLDIHKYLMLRSYKIMFGII